MKYSKMKISASVLSMLFICSHSFAQTKTENLANFETKKKASNKHSLVPDIAGKSMSKKVEQMKPEDFAAYEKEKVQLSNILTTPTGTSSNTTNPNSGVGLSTSFNHTDATVQFGATSMHGFTYNLSLKQTVTGADSVAVPLNLTGITSGSILKFSLQNTLHNGKGRAIVFYNVTATYNPKSYSYATDSFSLTEVQTNKDNYSFDGTLGAVINNRNGNFTNLFSANIAYSDVYKSAGNMSFSVPFGTSGNYYNVNDLAFGAPKETTSWVGTFEWKGGISNGIANSYKFGWALDYSTDFSGRYSIKLPIYFINGNEEKTTGLDGGIRLGYTNNTKDGKEMKSMEIFITTPFQILNNLTTTKRRSAAAGLGEGSN